MKYQMFPRNKPITKELFEVITVFESSITDISSKNHNLKSNQVLEIIRPGLERLQYRVERNRPNPERIKVAVLYGNNNAIEKYFLADALSSDESIVIEVEAGRAVENNQFLKDIFQASMMCDVEYLVIAVRNDYRGHDDFEKIYAFLETLYVSNRIELPLKGILLIGY